MLKTAATDIQLQRANTGNRTSWKYQAKMNHVNFIGKMNRKDFFKRLGSGAVLAAVAPSVLAKEAISGSVEVKQPVEEPISNTHSVERMVISSSGGLWIGTEAPSTRLEVK